MRPFDPSALRSFPDQMNEVGPLGQQYDNPGFEEDIALAWPNYKNNNSNCTCNKKYIYCNLIFFC